MAGIAAVVSLAACGGSSGPHTYIVAPTGKGVGALLATGIYITVVSPVAFPASVLASIKKSGTLVQSALGPLACSYSETVKNATGESAFLNGKTLTIKVNGSNPFTADICSSLQKQGFNPSNLGG